MSLQSSHGRVAPSMVTIGGTEKYMRTMVSRLESWLSLSVFLIVKTHSHI